MEGREIEDEKVPREVESGRGGGEKTALKKENPMCKFLNDSKVPQKKVGSAQPRIAKKN